MQDQTLHPVNHRGHWLLGIIPDFRRDVLGALTHLGTLGDVVRMRAGLFPITLVNHPELIKRIFVENRIYTKNTVSNQRITELLGQGLLTSEGDFWLRQRRIAQPAFHRQRIAGFGATMATAARALVARWEDPAARGEPLDVVAEMTRVTLGIVGETLFGSEVGEDGARVARAFDTLNHIAAERNRRLFISPLWLPTGENRRFRAALAELDGATYRIIAGRRAAKRETNDLLSMLMHTRDAESDESMNDRQLRDEVVTMLLAGYETTAVALSWALYLISQHPAVEERLVAELAVLGGRPPEPTDLERLPYARMIIDESMRLYPPVYAAMRMCEADDTLGGYTLPKGMLVLISSWIVHRHPALWQDPLAFRPERFAPEHAAALPRYAYFPFIGGPRQCIGNNFALMEAHLILATLYTRYRPRLVPGHPVVPEPLLTLRPRHGIRMTLVPATPATAPIPALAAS